MLELYVTLIRRFLDSEISANEFDISFWQIISSDREAWMSEEQYDVFEDLVYYVDAFCDIPEAFDEEQNIDEDELRRRAKQALDNLLKLESNK